MNAKDFLDLIRKVTDTEPRMRERGADEATDWVSAYTAAEAGATATVLAVTAASETDHAALEAQLHAILEIMATGHVQGSHIPQIREIDPQDLPTQIREYISDLLEE
ncbi:hypothetical protein [Streptomyces sp. MBT33]|uniref:hypothetical protein n=1 Tax=Streptomyces sp. MBT33 TaxID=1488363 RepID=UPI0019098112|nr:hypothetical protein [Streptomyces sp. MBT33]MBK3643903.1 hypothetical protein [Streptomyces sp. MBT33]